MVIRTATWVCLVSALLAAADSKPRYREAKAQYYLGVDGNREATSASTRMFEELQRQQPGEPHFDAYLGSLRLLESSRTLAIWRKGKLAKEGLALLDRSVEARPDDLEIRFVRAATTYHLPGMFKRESQCLEDLAAIARRVEAAVKEKRLEADIASTAMLYYGKLLARKSRLSEAQAAWRRAVDLGPATPAGLEAGKNLVR